MLTATTRAFRSAPRVCGLIRAFSVDKVEHFPQALKSPAHGIDILHDPLWNKGTAFEYSERDRLRLRGLLPPRVKPMEAQLSQVKKHLSKKDTSVRKNMYLQDLHNRNETLYHRLLMENIEEIAPLVYYPTIARVCQDFGDNFRRSRGMYFSRKDRGQFSAMTHNWPIKDVHIIVVTDGSRVQGMGDLGVHGMGIPIGKLALYCAAGGIAPHRVLPVVLDVGTNNQKYLESPHYLGIREPRLEGDEYFDLVDEFMSAVTGKWPNVVIQFGDFETAKAVPLLSRYRYKYRCFNDDIEGTGCVTLAGVLSAGKITNTDIKDMRFLCAGAGSAGLGVCEMIVDGMVAAGLPREEAMSRFVVCTDVGAIGAPDGTHGDPNHSRGLTENPSMPGKPHEPWINTAVSDGASMVDVARDFKPHVLLGLSAQGGLFDNDLISVVGAGVERPIIMPMSNPNSKSECTPEQAYRWTDGRAVVSTGSPFDPVELKGKTYVSSQCNNMYVFPGIGLAASVAGTRILTDKMFYKAALACSETMIESEVEDGRTFPCLKRIREVSLNVACAVIREGFEEGLNTKIHAADFEDDDSLEEFVARKMYKPYYVPVVNK